VELYHFDELADVLNYNKEYPAGYIIGLTEIIFQYHLSELLIADEIVLGHVDGCE
jgi:hypothetical protein